MKFNTKIIFATLLLLAVVIGLGSASGRTVAQCSYNISQSIGAGSCNTVGECWYKIASKVVGAQSCGTVGCTTCAVARKIASKELSQYDSFTVGTCSAAIAKHVGAGTGVWVTSVCGISDKVEKTKNLK